MKEESPEPGPEKAYCLLSSIFEEGILRLEPGETYAIGRDRKADISLRGHTVSRKHAQIAWVGIGEGGFIIEDLGSFNGVRVGGQKVAQHFLRDDEVISIGTFQLRYRELAGDIRLLLPEGPDDLAETKRLDVAAIAPDAILSGRFEACELMEISQLLSQNGRTGILEVVGEEVAGAIVLRDGRIAEAEAGDLLKLEAARLLLSQKSGSFEFRTTIPERKIRRGKLDEPGSVRGILLDIAREADESTRRLPAARSRRPSDTPNETDLADSTEDTLQE